MLCSFGISTEGISTCGAFIWKACLIPPFPPQNPVWHPGMHIIIVIGQKVKVTALACLITAIKGAFLGHKNRIKSELVLHYIVLKIDELIVYVLPIDDPLPVYIYTPKLFAQVICIIIALLHACTYIRLPHPCTDISILLSRGVWMILLICNLAKIRTGSNPLSLCSCILIHLRLLNLVSPVSLWIVVDSHYHCYLY